MEDLFCYFVNTSDRLDDKHILQKYKLKSGSLAELAFNELKQLYFYNPNSIIKSLKFSNYIFDFSSKYTIFEIKNYMYESSGTADEKIIYALIKYIPALSTFDNIIMVLCAKMEYLIKKYWNLIITTGLYDILNNHNIFIVNMSDLIGEFCFNLNKELDTMSFIKWVGGKSSILNDIISHFNISNDNETTYIEPFIGSGVIMIELLKTYPKLKIKANDINKQLIDTYATITNDVENLLILLNQLQREYNKSIDNESLYYQHRNTYNELIKDENINNETLIQDIIFDEFNLDITEINQTTLTSALFIYLNKTCFRGLYRVNKNGEFNVPFGHYKKPSITNPNLLRELSKLFKRVEFTCGDYKLVVNRAKYNDIIYLDPPYIDSFNDYSNSSFNHNEFRDIICSIKAKQIIISNSYSFWTNYKSDLKPLFDKFVINIHDRINSKSPDSNRKEIILVGKIFSK